MQDSEIERIAQTLKRFPSQFTMPSAGVIVPPANHNDYLLGGGQLEYRDWLVSQGILPDPIGEAIDDTFFSWHLADLTVAIQVAIAKEDGLQELTKAESQLLDNLLTFSKQNDQVIKSVLRGDRP